MTKLAAWSGKLRAYYLNILGELANFRRSMALYKTPRPLISDKENFVCVLCLSCIVQLLNMSDFTYLRTTNVLLPTTT
jgi:hypothetical protein